MKNIIIIAINTLKLSFRKKSDTIVYFILPIVTTVLLMLTIGNQTGGNELIAVSDNDKTTISENLLAYFKSTGKFKIIKISDNEINSKVVSEEASFAVKIPKGFGQSVYAGKASKVDIISIKGEDATAWINNYLKYYIKNINDIGKASDGNIEAFNKMYEGYKKEGMTLQINKVKDTRSGKEAVVYNLGFLIMFMMIGATATSGLILKERRNRTFYRICSSPVSARQYLMGNLIANLVRIIIQINIILFISEKVLRINLYASYFELFIVLTCIGVAAIGIGFLIVAFSYTSNQSGGLSNLIIIPTCMLGGCFWPLQIMPDKLQKLSKFVPQSWAMDAVNKLQGGKSFRDIALNIFILLAFSAVFFIVAAYKMSKQNNVENFI